MSLPPLRSSPRDPRSGRATRPRFRPLVTTIGMARGVLGAFGVLAAVGCSASGASNMSSADSLDIPAFDSISVRNVTDTARAMQAAVPRASTPRLTPLADSIGASMTFLATFQRAFVAAGRAKRLLVDIGRLNTKVTTPDERRAFVEAATALAPLRVGDRLRLRGPWGSDDALVTGYDQWNGRIVATLEVPPRVDSLARGKPPLVALAIRADSAEPATVDSCARDSVSGPLALRVSVLRDSLANAAGADTASFPPRLAASRRVAVGQAVGCFGAGRVVLFATTIGGAYEHVRERAVLVDTAGTALPLRVSDLRFKAHEPLRVFDADGDGVDDIAALGHAERTGGTVILHLDPSRQRLDYVMSGFAWENY
ncbi:MAG TPA: hypothetical protein VF041_02660 [Gemmatimonadaceae bacterium]